MDLTFCACGKRSFETRGKANKAARALERRTGGGKNTAYLCTMGGVWHHGRHHTQVTSAYARTRENASA